MPTSGNSALMAIWKQSKTPTIVGTHSAAVSTLESAT